MTIAAATATALGLAAFVPSFAAGTVPTTAPPGATVTTITIQLKHGLPEFVSPASVKTGDYLQVVNNTKPHQVGPHTFALVTPGSVPKTKKQRHICFTKHHICRSIAGWFGVQGNGAPSVNPVDAGLPGWDTAGNNTGTKGDAWFTTNKPNTSIVQQVSAAAGTALTFQCAIHPWMHGSIQVTG
jgi:hypothetical protein